MKKKGRIMSSIELLRQVNRELAHKRYVEDMQEGRVQRAHTFRPKKGKGSYRRKNKHKGDSL